MLMFLNSFFKSGFPFRSLITTWVLSILLIASAVITCFSPLNREYGLYALAAVTLGGGLAYLFSKRVHPHNRNRFSVLTLGILSQIAAATAQAITAVRLPSSFFLPVNDLPGVVEVFLLLAGCAAFMLIRLESWGLGGSLWGTLISAGIFSSIIYLRSFTVAEAGPIYNSIIALTLTSAFIVINHEHSQNFVHLFFCSHLAIWIMFFLTAYGVASLLSPTSSDSLNAWLKLVSVVNLAFLLAIALLQQEDNVESILHWRHLPPRLISRLDSIHWDTIKTWKAFAWGTVVIAGVIPILLGSIKFTSMVWRFDLPSAIIYRLHPNEIGGANLIARSVLCVVTLGLVIILNSESLSKSRRWVATAWIISCVALLVYSQSWEGVFALVVSLVVFLLVSHWNSLRRIWMEKLHLQIMRIGIIVALVGVLLAAGFFFGKIAQQVNINSFNGRLYHWQAAIYAWMDHPWVGGGPANEIIYTPYAGRMNLPSQSQITQDDIPYLLSIQSGYPVKWHSHNLFLEIGSTTGLLGFVPFIGFLIALFGLGLRIACSDHGFWKFAGAACLAGISGELAWGVMDVTWVTPPYFSNPVWCLLGLLLAAEFMRLRVSFPKVNFSKWSKPQKAFMNGALLVMTFGVVLLSAMSSYYYATGFLAFQEHRWNDAVHGFEQSVKYSPLDAKSYELLAKSRLEIGDLSGARAGFEKANEVKQGNAPYLAQLGLISWLQGDTEKATDYFQEAIKIDPYETWYEGLYANLGLLEASHGNNDVSVDLIKQSIELHPELASAFYWRPVQQTTDGIESGDLVLDPVYQNGLSEDLDLRIRKQLGVSNITERNFSTVLVTQTTILLRDVLDAIEADYLQARFNDDKKSILLLAALSEASTNSGMIRHAESAFLNFQTDIPESVYGYRSLGILYRLSGKTPEAENALSRAKAIRPGDYATNYQLLQIYLDQGKWDKASQELDLIFAQGLTTLFHTTLFDPELYKTQARLYDGESKIVLAEKALQKVAYLSNTPSAYLQVAKYYQDNGNEDHAAKLCLQAAKIFFSKWQSPQSTELLDIGQCLAAPNRSYIDAVENSAMSRQSHFLSKLLIGHIYRSDGDYENAEAAYKRASELRPFEGAPYYFLGELYQEIGSNDQAAQAYQHAAQLEPHESLALLAMGKMQWASGQKMAALGSYRAAVSITPGWQDAHISLGNILFELGNFEEANSHFQTALDLQIPFNVERRFELLGHLGETRIQSPGANYVRVDQFIINNQKKIVLFMHPDSSVEYELNLPDLETGEELWLNFWTGLSPEVWNQAGDGVHFVISLEEGISSQEIFTIYIDPKQNIEDRHWQLERINLSAYQGKEIKLKFMTDSGPNNDNRFDWAGWGDPAIIINNVPNMAP